MQILQGHRTRPLFPNTERDWPLEARAATFVLEAAAGDASTLERRNIPRPPCRIEATLSPADDPAALGEVLIYTRDIDRGHLGFICHRELPQGYRVDLHLTIEHAGPLHISATIIRCRQFMEGWYEGVLRFDEPRADLGEAA
jgi:hypothetical protein